MSAQATDRPPRAVAFFAAAVVLPECEAYDHAETPIGHQCDRLVTEPVGCRFGDYARPGVPLSLPVLMTGTPLIMFFRPPARCTGYLFDPV